jgi:hypothetical protein
MKAKFVFESIKHLKPRSEEEIKSCLKNLSPKEKLETGAEEGLLWLIKDALDTGADVHAWNDWALRWASAKGHVEVVKVLLDAGANVHARDDEALQWASYNGHVEVVKVLLEAGADVNAEDDEALRWASENGHVEVVKVLLDAGANVHAWDDRALRWASAKGHVEVIKLLKQHGTRKNVNESIKHLKPFSKEEIISRWKNLPEEEIDKDAPGYFDYWRKNIQDAKNISELIDAKLMWDDSPQVIEIITKELKKFFNQKFKGNLEKSKAWCIKEINTYEYNFWERTQDY